MKNPALALKKKLASLPDSRKRKLRSWGQFALRFVPHKHSLEMLCIKYGGDKLSHNYTEHYQRLFSPIRKRKLKILEIGVGGFDDPNAGGESLRMWRDFFPNSMIYGIDIFDKHGVDDRRIKTFKGDQSCPEFLGELIAQIGQPDIIIDDGSHRNEHVLASFHTLFPHLAHDGYYVIEDLYTSYWKCMGGNWENGQEKDTSIAMLKSLIDSLNYRYIPGRIPSQLDRDVVSLNFYRKLVIIQKGHNEMEEPTHIVENLRAEESHLGTLRKTTPLSQAHSQS